MEENQWIAIEDQDPLPSITEQLVGKVYGDIIRQLEELIKRKFLEKTGEELTKDNAHRVVILVPPHSCILDKIEVYTVDSIPVLEVHPLEIGNPLNGAVDGWKISVKQQYREL